MTDHIVLVRASTDLFATMFTRDHDGNRLRIEWGEADAVGFHEPVISVDYTDNIHAADKATIARLRAIEEAARAVTAYYDPERVEPHDSGAPHRRLHALRAALDGSER
jgi:hypothetical protein